MKKIITIGREFGSGGRELAKRLADELGYEYYDNEIMTEIAKRTDLCENYIASVIEKSPSSSYPIHIARSFHPIVTPLMDQTNKVCQQQTAIIKELGEKGDCIIVGRCADYILRDYNPIRIFVYAEMEEKIKRCREKDKDVESLTDREVEKQIKAIDRNRKKYYDFYTGQEWGKRINYDILINTSRIPMKIIVSELAALIRGIK